MTDPSDMYRELHNPKAVRINQDADNHCLECSGMKDSLLRAQQDVRMVRERASRYYKMLQQISGKAAILRVENNALRRKIERKNTDD